MVLSVIEEELIAEIMMIMVPKSHLVMLIIFYSLCLLTR